MFHRRHKAPPAAKALIPYRPPGFFKKLLLDWEETEMEISKIPASVGTELKNLFQRILYGFARPSTYARTAMDMVALACLSLCLALFCSMKEGGMDLYMTTFLPVLGVLAVLCAFTESLRSSRSFVFIISLLILTGFALQTLLKLPAKGSVSPSNADLVLYAVISTAAGLFALPIVSVIIRCIPKRIAIRLLNLCILALYLCLMVFGRYIYGTKAWIYIGPFSLQMTEIIKLITLVTFAIEFTDETTEPKRRLRWAALTLLINCAFLLIANEFGTLLVIAAGFFFLAFAYLPSLFQIIRIVALLLALLCALLLACRVCNTLEEKNQELHPDERVSFAVEQGARIYRKFKLRTDVIFHPETVDPNNGGYQAVRARNAILLSGWIGSPYEVSIPVVESDYIFDYLLLRMGVLFGILVLLLMLSMCLNAVLLCLKNPLPGEAAAGTVLAFSISFQSVLAAASAMGQFLTVGIPFAFLASGGTSSLVNYTAVIYILYAMRRVSPADSGRRRRAPVERSDVV